MNGSKPTGSASENQVEWRRFESRRRSDGSIERAAAEAQRRRGVKQWKYCCDFNERCKDVGYLMAFLAEIKRLAPEALTRLQYIEQPTSRDLKSNLNNVMHEAAKIVPIAADESLVDLESFHLSRRLGYSGVALKSAKGKRMRC